MSKNKTYIGDGQEDNFSSSKELLNKYEYLFDVLKSQSKDGILEMSPIFKNEVDIVDFRIEYVNKVISSSFTFTIGLSLLETNHSEFFQKWFQNLKHAFKTNSESKFEFFDENSQTNYSITIFIKPDGKSVMCLLNEKRKTNPEAANLISSNSHEETHLKSLMKSADGFAIFRMKFLDTTAPEKGEVIFVSPAIKDLLFLEHPHRIDDWLKGGTKQFISGLLQKVSVQLEGSSQENYTITKRNPNTGEVRHLQFATKSEKIGNAYYLNGTLFDVTSQKASEIKLQNSEAKFRSLFDVSYDSILVIDIDTLRITEANDSAIETYGYTREELINMTILDIYSLSDNIISVIEECHSEHKVIDYHHMHLRKAGDEFPCDISASLVNINNQSMMVLSVKDISENIEYLNQLQNSDRRYSQASLITKSAVWELLAEDRKIYCDSNFARIFGYETKEPPNDLNFWLDHVHFDDKPEIEKNIFEAINGTRESIEHEHRIVRKNGEEAWVYVRCIKISNEGEPVRFLGTILDTTEKKKIELKEKEHKKILESVLTSMVEGVIMVNKEGVQVLFNDSAIEILGHGPIEDLDLKDWVSTYGVYKPDKKTLFPIDELSLFRSLKGVTILWQEIYIKNKFIEEGKFILASSNPVYKEDGTIYGAVVIFSDITEQRRYVERLKTTEGRYLQASKLGKLATFEIQPQKKKLIYDESLRNLLGYEFKEFDEILNKWLSLVPEEDHDSIYSVIDKYLSKDQNESRIIHRIKRRDGAMRWVEIRSRNIFNKDSNSYHIIGTIVDITEQKEAGDEILKREELLNETGKMAKVGGWELNVASNKLTWSNQTYNIYELNLSEKVSLYSMISFCKPDYVELFSEEIESAIQNQDIISVEVEIISDKGTDKWIKLIGKPIVIKNKVTRIIGAIQDISGQKTTEEELIFAKEKAEQSDRIKSAFLTTMSHELRTPLNAVIGFSEIMDHTMPKEDMIEFAQQINTSGNHLLNIIEDIFDISLIESGEAKLRNSEFDLNLLLDELFQVMLNEKQKLNKDEIDLKLIKTSSTEKFMVYTDLARYRQILSNLIKNALKFTHNGFVEFGYYLKDGQLITVIKDSGIGIPKKLHEIIFERFRQVEDTNTREYGGTGLGLYICKKILEIMNGEIWVDSFPGTGSTFYFSLPLENYHTIETSRKVSKDPTEVIDMSVFRNKEVLIVEDEESNYLLLERILSKTPININWVKNGLDAVTFCLEEEVDIVLMDIQLPKLNGFEATKQIKAKKPNLPIIAQTAYAMSGDREKSEKAGCDDYLSKPINRSELYRIILHYLQN